MNSRYRPSLGLRAIRLRISAGATNLYAVLRYDALYTGRVAVAIMNLQSTDSVALLNVSQLPQNAVNIQPSSFSWNKK